MGKASFHCCSPVPVFANICSSQTQGWLLAQSTATAGLQWGGEQPRTATQEFLSCSGLSKADHITFCFSTPPNILANLLTGKILCRWTWDLVVQVLAIPMRQWGQVKPSEIYIYTWKLLAILLFFSPETAPLPQPWETHAHAHRDTEKQSIDTLRKPLIPCRASRILIISIIIELDKIHLTCRMLGSVGDAMPHFTSITTCSKVVVSNSIW